MTEAEAKSDCDCCGLESVGSGQWAMLTIPSWHVWIPVGVQIQVKAERQVSCKRGNSQRKKQTMYICMVKRISFVYSASLTGNLKLVLLYNPIFSIVFKEQHYSVIQTVVKHLVACCIWPNGKPVAVLQSSWLKGCNGQTPRWFNVNLETDPCISWLLTNWPASIHILENLA